MLRLENATLGTVRNSRSCGGITVSTTLYASRAKLPAHEHGHAYLCLIADGEYCQTAGARSDDCRRGTLMVHPEGHKHADHFGSGGARCINIHVDRALTGDIAVRRLLGDYRRLDLPAGPALLSRIECELAAGDEAAPLSLQAATLELVALACRQDRCDDVPGWMVRVFEKLHDDPCRAPSVAELAALAGVHPAHLARSFHRVSGFTIGDYLRRLRIGRACAELSASRRPIAMIALDAGFADQSHFSRMFRHVTGETPRAWRQRMQNPS